MANAPLYKRRRRYTRELHDVELHDNYKLHVVCTSKPRNVDRMLSTLRRKLGGLPVKTVSVDVEYTHYDVLQKATLLELCVEEDCFVYHISTVTERPLQLDEFLMNKEYTFAGFGIKGDKRKLRLSGLKINSDNYIDIQVEWRDPYCKKEFDSLADVAGRVIDKHYKDMKKKINHEEDHTLWGFCPLLDKSIKYVAIDAYASYESWKHIDDIAMGLQRAKEWKEKDAIKYGNKE